MEGVGSTPSLAAWDSRDTVLTRLLPRAPPLSLQLLLQRGAEVPVGALGDELLGAAFGHAGLVQAQGVERTVSSDHIAANCRRARLSRSGGHSHSGSRSLVHSDWATRSGSRDQMGSQGTFVS